jgi:hypothetical protein
VTDDQSFPEGFLPPGMTPEHLPPGMRELFTRLQAVMASMSEYAKADRQKTGHGLELAECQIEHAQAVVVAAQAELAMWQAELLDPALASNVRRRTYVEAKIATTRTYVAAVQAMAKTERKAYELRQLLAARSMHDDPGSLFAGLFGGQPPQRPGDDLITGTHKDKRDGDEPDNPAGV